MSRLQSVLRAAARLVLQLPGQAPVSSAMLNSLHWLNFPQRVTVTYKLCLLTYKCLHGLAPDYLTRLCARVATVHGRPRLRSSNDHQLLIRWTSTVTLARKFFKSILILPLLLSTPSYLHARRVPVVWL